MEELEKSDEPNTFLLRFILSILFVLLPRIVDMNAAETTMDITR